MTDMQGPLELTLREKILVWIVAVEESDETGVAATQAEISTRTGQSRGHVSRTLDSMVKNGLLKEQRVRVPGFSRALKAYRVTPEGRAEFRGLRDGLLSMSVPLATRAGEPPMMRPLADVVPKQADAMVLWHALARLWSEGRLEGDPENLTKKASGLRPRFRRDWDEAPPRPPIFVGREKELEALKRWHKGDSGLLVVEAPGGVGKSSLLLKFMERDPPNRHVLWVRIHPWTKRQSIVAELDDFMRRLGRNLPVSRTIAHDELEDHLRRGLRGVPVLLVIDDIQKASAETQATIVEITRVARRLPTLKVLLAGRFVELAEQRLRPEERLLLSPLGSKEAESLLEKHGVPRSRWEEIIQAAGGIPLFLELLAQRAPDRKDGGITNRQLITDLGAELGEEHQEILCLVSATRVPVHESLLERLRVGSKGALDDLVRMGLVQHRDDGRYQMHDMVSAAFYERIPYRERARIHSRLADAYRPSKQSRADDEGELTMITEYLHHLAEAERREEAVRWALRNQKRIMENAERHFVGAQAPGRSVT